MQGTIVMLMALSGLGCHHKGCAPVATTACYDGCYGGCYGTAPAAYVAPVVDCCPTAYVAPSCYGGCYGSATSGYMAAACYDTGGCYGGGCYGGACYGGGCYGGGHGHRKLFGGLFHHRRAAACNPCEFPVVASCYGGSYTPAVFGGLHAGLRRRPGLRVLADLRHGSDLVAGPGAFEGHGRPRPVERRPGHDHPDPNPGPGPPAPRAGGRHPDPGPPARGPRGPGHAPGPPGRPDGPQDLSAPRLASPLWKKRPQGA